MNGVKLVLTIYHIFISNFQVFLPIVTRKIGDRGTNDPFLFHDFRYFEKFSRFGFVGVCSVELCEKVL